MNDEAQDVLAVARVEAEIRKRSINWGLRDESRSDGARIVAGRLGWTEERALAAIDRWVVRGVATEPSEPEPSGALPLTPPEHFTHEAIRVGLNAAEWPSREGT